MSALGPARTGKAAGARDRTPACPPSGLHLIHLVGPGGVGLFRTGNAWWYTAHTLSCTSATDPAPSTTATRSVGMWLAEVAVEFGKRPLHLALVVQLRSFAALQAAFGSEVGGDVEHDGELGPAHVAVQAPDPLHRVLGRRAARHALVRQGSTRRSRSESTTPPVATNGSISLSTWSMRSAANSSAIVAHPGASPPGTTTRPVSTWRTSVPTGPSLGSRVMRTGTRPARSRSARRATCVVVPAPSIPSSTTSRPALDAIRRMAIAQVPSRSKGQSGVPTLIRVITG